MIRHIKLYTLHICFFLICSVGIGKPLVTNGLSHEFTLEPGSQQEGTIELHNSGSTAISISIKKRDVDTNLNGRAKIVGAGELPRSNAHWISFFPNKLEMAANSKAAIRFKISVPNKSNSPIYSRQFGNDLSGTFWSMVILESRLVEEPQLSTQEISGAAVTISIQYGVQLITHIGKKAAPKLTVNDAQITRTDSGKNISVELFNSGINLARPTVKLELYKHDGTKVKSWQAKPKRIYPKAVYKNNFNCDNLPSGKYNALVVADCGGEDVFGRQIMLTIEK